MKKSFTLIELLIVIAIIGILAMMGFASYFNSLKSARDARRKGDLQTLQKALELYYQDNNAYPLDVIPNPFCHPGGCDTAQYLPAVPTDSGTSYTYDSNDGTYYKLYSCIENPNDKGPGVNQTGYQVGTIVCGTGRCETCRFGVSSSNITP